VGIAVLRLVRSVTRGAGDAAEAWLDVIFPPRCVGCGRTGAHFCAACVAALAPVRPPWCASCGRSLPFGVLCPECRLDRLPLAAVRSAARFDGPLRRAVHRLKYRGHAPAGRALAALLVDPARSLGLARPALPAAPALGPEGRERSEGPPAVVPVPLHPARQRERGYNQAALLAQPLAAALGLPYDAHVLRRVKPTPPQVGLSRQERRRNLRHAFSAEPGIAGRTIVLVDDVVTTGSTLASAAQACLAAGAARVYGLSLARQDQS
jgi:ComF family protein